MKKTFALFDWRRPFLPDVYKYICEHTDGLKQHSLLILPHKRPRRYILDMLRRDTHVSRPVLVPRMLTIAELVQCIRPHSSGLRTASHLDRMHVLHTCVCKVAEETSDYGGNDSGGAFGGIATFDTSIRQQFSSMSLAQFLPWGTRLASLFEEYMVQYIPVRNIHHTEGDVSSKAAALLSALERIHAHYIALLHENAWTTPGLDAFMAARHILSAGEAHNSALPHTLCPSAERHVFIVGFSAPTRTEHILFKELWHRGAHVCLHTDDASATQESGETGKAQRKQSTHVHWTCADHVHWMREWKAQGRMVTEAQAYKKPVYHFVAGYDVHSQLQEVESLLRTDDRTQSTALVLTSPDVLMPMLHHMPHMSQGAMGNVMEFNISMGYPLNKSPLMALLDAIFRMHASARTQGESVVFYWRHVLHCLQHPYITMLTAAEGDLSAMALTHLEAQLSHKSAQHDDMRPLLNIVERRLRQGHAYVEPVQLVDTLLGDMEAPPAAAGLLRKIVHCLVTQCAAPTTTFEMGDALLNLCHMLLDEGYDVWERYPLDAESLYRLIKHCIPALKGSTLAHEILPRETLFHITQELMAQERVPFEADPLTGLQILGMLETRLLHFERVIFVDATDDVLPGFSAQDPLLPDALRSVIGLPSTQTRERLMAHTFYRLMASAKNVHFFWQESEGLLLEQKKVRSRFVDACLWEEEQVCGHIIDKGSERLRSAECPLRPVVTRARSLVRTECIQERLRVMMEKGISPTQIDMYMRCPQRFAWHYVYGLRPLDSAREGEDALATGDLLHRVMEQFYGAYRGLDFYKDHVKPEDMRLVYKTCLAGSPLLDSLPADSLLMLEIITPLRLTAYFEQQPDVTRIVDVEKDMRAPLYLPHDDFTCHLWGKADRLDKRVCDTSNADQLLVLDYKTGSIPTHSLKSWTDDALFERIRKWQPCNEASDMKDDLLATVAEIFSSLQLPAYMFMAQHMYGADTVADAAWIDLGKTGKEIFFMGADVDVQTRNRILTERVPLVLGFVARHMFSATHFMAQESSRCAYCPFAGLCQG